MVLRGNRVLSLSRKCSFICCRLYNTSWTSLGVTQPSRLNSFVSRYNSYVVLSSSYKTISIIHVWIFIALLHQALNQRLMCLSLMFNKKEKIDNTLQVGSEPSSSPHADQQQVGSFIGSLGLSLCNLKMCCQTCGKSMR